MACVFHLGEDRSASLRAYLGKKGFERLPCDVAGLTYMWQSKSGLMFREWLEGEQVRWEPVGKAPLEWLQNTSLNITDIDDDGLLSVLMTLAIRTEQPL